jgi:hypothetical protein
MLGGGDLRRAIEAEAGGDYLEAARAYAAAGERHKVAEMHLLASERAPGADGKLDALREASRWADGDDEPSRRVRRRVAAALLAWVKARGLVTEGDREVVREAAALFVSAGDAAGAGTCHELLGAAEAAAAAYQSAGEVDRLEQLLDGEADRRRRAVAVREALEEHRFRLRGGDPASALAALDGALAAAEPRERAELSRARDELCARRLPPGRLVLLRAGAPALVIARAAPSIVIGRDADATLTLRDGGVSRRHVELRYEAGWRVTDLGSKNGTTLAGARLAGTLSLPPAGELSVGELCTIGFRQEGTTLELEIVRGMDRGLQLTAAPGTARIAEAGAPLVTVSFGRDGRARISTAGRPLFLNGSSIGGALEPLVGDVLEILREGAPVRWEVGA